VFKCSIKSTFLILLLLILNILYISINFRTVRFYELKALKSPPSSTPNAIVDRNDFGRR